MSGQGRELPGLILDAVHFGSAQLDEQVVEVVEQKQGDNFREQEKNECGFAQGTPQLYLQVTGQAVEDGFRKEQ